MTTKDELESLFDEASNYLRLKTGVAVSWMFTDWQNHKQRNCDRQKQRRQRSEAVCKVHFL